MKIKINLTILFIAIAFAVFAQKKALETITENDLKAHLEFIASDYMQGRDFNTETPGLELIADYYSQHPIIPLENTLVDINLDMVGRSAEKEPEKGAEMEKSLAGPNGLYIVSGKQSSELMEISDEICKDLGLVPSDELTKAFLTRSDYYHFFKNGVPILGLSTGLHEDYHKPSDELDKIDYFKMKRIADYCFLMAYEVANKKNRIEVDKPVTKK